MMWNAWFQAWGDSWGTSWGPLHEVAETWDTAQGIAANAVRFIPIRDAEAAIVSRGAESGTCVVEVESRSITVAVPKGTRAIAGTTCVSIQCYAAPSARAAGARAGQGDFSVVVFAAAKAQSHAARSGYGRVRVSGFADATPCSTYGRSGARVVAKCDVVLNPSDDEIISWYLARRRLTNM